MTNVPNLVALTDNATLQEKLRQVVSHSSDMKVSVAFLYEGRAGYATTRDLSGGAPEDVPVQTGCVTKLLTSALIVNAAGEGRLQLDNEASALLGPTSGASAKTLLGISVRDFLNHTHGLDDCCAQETPLRADGFIDVEALCKVAGSMKRLAAPAEICSYSDVGSRVLAAVLEKIYGKPYRAVLEEKLLAPMGVKLPSRQANSKTIDCPSRGLGLMVPIGGLLKFLSTYGFETQGEVVALPGWNSIERGIVRGWKVYEGGWRGHNSDLPEAAAMVRVLPEEKIAIIVESGTHSPAPIMAALFGKLLPNLVSLKIPRRLREPEVAALEPERYVGTYGNASLAISISSSAPAALKLSAYHRTDDGKTDTVPFIETPLQAAEDGIFFPKLQPDMHLFPFVQFIRSGDGNVQHLWNGKSAWPALSVAAGP